MCDTLKNQLIFFKGYLQYLSLRKSFSNRREADIFRKMQLSALLNYAQRHCSYYTSLFSDREITPDNCIDILKTLPILTKDIIRLRTNSIYSDELNSKPYSNRTTGGSTGEPFGFKVMSQKLDFEFLLGYHLYHLMGWKYNETIVAFDGYVPPAKDNLFNVKIFKESVNFPYGKYHFSSFYLSEDTIDKYVAELNRILPVVFRGYSSTISDFCKLIKKKKLRLNFQLKGLYVTSDKCTEEDEQIIKEVLHCPVWGQYGHTEVSIFAIKPDNTQTYLCSPIYGFTEILNRETNKHVLKGELGEVVVTGFTNYALPFIRYATGDLAIYGGEDEYHNTIITDLQGRSTDYILNNNGKKIYLTGLIFGAHLKSFQHIDEWQIEQNKLGYIKLKIRKGLDYSIEDENEIISLFISVGVNVSIDYNETITKSKRGKRLFMIQNCK